MTSRNPATLHTDRLDAYINLDRYPIHDLGSKAGKTLIADAQEMMERDTLCLLEGFLRESAVSDLSGEIGKLEAGAHRVDYPSTNEKNGTEKNGTEKNGTDLFNRKGCYVINKSVPLFIQCSVTGSLWRMSRKGGAPAPPFLCP
jgi:hypothetical protein